MLNLSHKTLDVYKISLSFVKEIYKIPNDFPKHEQYILVSQLRRAAVSVSSNIAEGASGISAKEKKRFYEISRSSLVEVDTQIEISSMMSYLKITEITVLEKYMESIFKMLSKMITNLDLHPH